jgi:hypothetical protein
MKHSTLIFIALITGLSTPLARAESGLDNPAASSAFGTSAMTDDALSNQRGMALVNNTSDLNGNLYDNNASDVVTGNNLVSSGSLANNNGFNTVIQNSGNNVLIQNSLILNLQMQ